MKIKITATIIYFYRNVHINNFNMLYYNRIDISDGIYVNKTSESKNCHIRVF